MDRFNTMYIEFLGALKKDFPSFKKYFVVKDNHKYLVDFIELTLPYMEDISIRNVDAFRYKHTGMELVRGLKFSNVLDYFYEKKMSQIVLETIWRSLHNMYVVAYNSCSLKNILQKNNKKNLLAILENHNILVENIMLSGHPIIEDRRDSSSDYDSEDVSDEEAELREQFKRAQRGEDVDEPTPEGDNNTGMPNLENMFEGSSIGNIVKELSEEINEEDFGDISNPADLLGSLLNPSEEGGDNKLQNIMTKVMQTMDTKMKNGEINQEQMMNEAQGMMGSLGPMMQGLGGNGQGGGLDLNSLMGMMGGMNNGGGNGGNRRSRRSRGQRKRR
jgi:hypothetical protein